MLAGQRKSEIAPSACMFDSGIERIKPDKMRLCFDEDENFKETQQPLEGGVNLSIALQENHHQTPNSVFDHLVDCLYQFDKISEPYWYQIGGSKKRKCYPTIGAFHQLFFLPKGRGLDMLCESGLIEMRNTGELRFKRVATEVLQAKIPSCEFMLPEYWQRVCYLRIGSAKCCNRERVTYSLSHQMKMRLRRPKFALPLYPIVHTFRSQYLAKVMRDADGNRDTAPTLACGNEARALRTITNEIPLTEIQPKRDSVLSTPVAGKQERALRTVTNEIPQMEIQPKRDSVLTTLVAGKQARALRNITNEIPQTEIQPKRVRDANLTQKGGTFAL
ncbi:unnamed protein product [Cylindrotheca closterium]|uniref:Uncharacterized protein n=1 Tax=Cylindrotheca closterium TaxID=2856 RepID=A0AAD2FGP4_9STRA|nr:unnamed protein product [Cylindrotheca closterium]